MKVTIEQILEREERLEREILERQCYLGAIQALRAHLQNRPEKESLELGTLASMIAAPTFPALPKEAIELLLADSTSAPAQLPAAPRVECYIHPELKAIGTRFGSKTEAVCWAIRHMTDDYSV